MQVLALDDAEPFWIIPIGGTVPVTLVKVLLQPGRLRKALAVNGFNLSSQNRPFCAGVLAKFLSRERAVLIETHVTRLHGVMLLGLRNANHVEVLAFGIVERRILKVRIGFEPGARFEKAPDVRIFEDAAVLAKDNATDEL